jgi:hypothetical protein
VPKEEGTPLSGHDAGRSDTSGEDGSGDTAEEMHYAEQEEFYEVELLAGDEACCVAGWQDLEDKETSRFAGEESNPDRDDGIDESDEEGGSSSDSEESDAGPVETSSFLDKSEFYTCHSLARAEDLQPEEVLLPSNTSTPR